MPIICENVRHIYDAETNHPIIAINDIVTTIKDDIITAVIGCTGSGKSTLIQHFNGLLLPTSGTIYINDFKIESNHNYKFKELRSKVGIVFQFPEYQLFDETVLKDVMFGPLNFKVPFEDAKKQAVLALKQVGIDESLYERSPIELSGGQKRRIAIAGILAMNPSILVLDEPTAGLDPKGAKDMMDLFNSLHKTIIMVTHDMDHVKNYSKDVIVLDKGHIIYNDTTINMFANSDILDKLNIEKPMIIKCIELLESKNIKIDKSILNIAELVNFLVEKINNG